MCIYIHIAILMHISKQVTEDKINSFKNSNALIFRHLLKAEFNNMLLLARITQETTLENHGVAVAREKMHLLCLRHHYF